MSFEHVVTDSAGVPIAVVRHASWMRADVPPWCDRDGCAVVLGKPGDAPALLIASDGLDSRRAQVSVVPGARLGTLRSTFWLGRLRYTEMSASTDAAAASPTQEGRVRSRGWYYLSNDAWTVIDAAGMERAHIARRHSRSSVATVERQPADSPVLTRLGKLTRDVLSRRPLACEVIESCRTFDWDEHGLRVALAALCDHWVRQRAFPVSRSGG